MKGATHTRSRKFQWTLGGIATLAVATAGYAATADGPVPKAGAPSEPRCVHSADDLSIAFERVADSIHRSVVSIKSVNRVETKQAVQVLPFHGLPFGDLFGFQGDAFRRLHPSVPPHGFVQQGIGTGFIVSEDGYILTNNHVIKDADEVTVSLWDDSTHAASVVGTDPKTDLAVLKIDAEGLVPAPLGDDERLRVGHWVAAVGNPFGLSSTMTAGIVSAVGRSRVGLADYEDFIQTDAAINPGNSGGPLVNLAGEVVGINTAIFSKNGGYMGIGFAIPINMARAIVDSLIEDGYVERGFLGVVIQNLSEDLAASFGHDGTDGALVSDVPEDSPADRAGLEPGDIIVRLDGRTIEDVDALKLMVANTRPGTTVAVELVRGGDALTKEVEIGELEPAPVATAAKANAKSLGMNVETLTPRLAQRLQMSDRQTGALVTRVEPFGVAAQAGVRLNDVILEVDGVGDRERRRLRARLRDKSTPPRVPVSPS